MATLFPMSFQSVWPSPYFFPVIIVPRVGQVGSETLPVHPHPIRFMQVGHNPSCKCCCHDNKRIETCQLMVSVTTTSIRFWNRGKHLHSCLVLITFIEARTMRYRCRTTADVPNRLWGILRRMLPSGTCYMHTTNMNILRHESREVRE